MTINEKIIAALAETELLVTPDAKSADDQKYFVFNYFSSGDDFGDDMPQHEKYSIQIHLFCPDDFDSVKLRGQTKRLLLRAGFTFPMVVDASDEDGQHWVFECELEEEVESDG